MDLIRCCQTAKYRLHRGPLPRVKMLITIGVESPPPPRVGPWSGPARVPGSFVSDPAKTAPCHPTWKPDQDHVDCTGLVAGHYRDGSPSLRVGPQEGTDLVGSPTRVGQVCRVVGSFPPPPPILTPSERARTHNHKHTCRETLDPFRQINWASKVRLTRRRSN